MSVSFRGLWELSDQNMSAVYTWTEFITAAKLIKIHKIHATRSVNYLTLPWEVMSRKISAGSDKSILQRLNRQSPSVRSIMSIFLPLISCFRCFGNWNRKMRQTQGKWLRVGNLGIAGSCSTGDIEFFSMFNTTDSAH